MRKSTIPPQINVPKHQRAIDDRWRLLRLHLEENAPVASIAAEAGVSMRTIQRWIRRFRKFGRTGLARTGRADRGIRRRISDQLRQLAESLSLQGPPAPGATAIYRELCRAAEASGYTPPRFSTVYSVIRATSKPPKRPTSEGKQSYHTAFDLAPPDQNWGVAPDMSFEDALAELERIVRELETGNVPLPDALKTYERGALLKRHCEDKLAEAQARVAPISSG